MTATHKSPLVRAVRATDQVQPIGDNAIRCMRISTPEGDMLPDSKTDALKRLNYIEGHIAGVRRMVEEDRYCVDVLKQTFAIRRAIKKLEQVLIEGHLHSCVVTGLQEGRGDEVLDELVELYAMGDR